MISSRSRFIKLGIFGRTSCTTKEKPGFWSSRDLVIPIGLTIYSGDLGQALASGHFGSLSKELHDLGNIS
jgi:hypothetical protein